MKKKQSERGWILPGSMDVRAQGLLCPVSSRKQDDQQRAASLGRTAKKLGDGKS